MKHSIASRAAEPAAALPAQATEPASLPKLGRDVASRVAGTLEVLPEMLPERIGDTCCCTGFSARILPSDILNRAKPWKGSYGRKIIELTHGEARELAALLDEGDGYRPALVTALQGELKGDLTAALAVELRGPRDKDAQFGVLYAQPWKGPSIPIAKKAA